MSRYLRMLGLFWSTSLAAEMEYRANFAVAALTSLGNLVGSVFWVGLFYTAGNGLGDWAWEKSLLVIGMFTLLQGISSAVLGPNLSWIVRHVQRGTLDFVLLKPMSSQFWLSTRILSPWGLPDIISGMLLLGYAGYRLGLGPLDYLSGVVPLMLGVIILYSIWFMLGSTSIWFVKIYNVTEVLRGLMEAGRFPREAYPPVLRFFFTFIVPVAFLTTVPAEAMSNGGQAMMTWLPLAALIAGLLFVASAMFWRFALRFYTSASS